ncbi:MAG: hypothetical protein O9327_19915 [Polaromonas sp.]|nr:hypothetical protein [Polaromonas sp.]
MSWDVFVARYSREYEALGDIPETECCMPLGSRAEVHAAISQHFGATDWSDPAWGRFNSPHGSIEFSVGEDKPNTGFMMHIRASAAVVQLIVAMCVAQRWQALDCNTGEFLERAQNAAAGLERWTAYRNQVVGGV